MCSKMRHVYVDSIGMSIQATYTDCIGNQFQRKMHQCRNLCAATRISPIARMQQRSIAAAAVDTLLTFDRSSYHRGREVVYIDLTAFR
ncbi:hypothetical protein D3C72_873770 [compost metagenome]